MYSFYKEGCPRAYRLRWIHHTCIWWCFMGIPQCRSSIHRIILSRLSKAFSKSTKIMNCDDCHSMHCYSIILSDAMWSVQELFFRKPACSLLKILSSGPWILSRLIQKRILLGTESSMMPLQFLYSLRFPFFGTLRINPCGGNSQSQLYKLTKLVRIKSHPNV